MNEKLFFPCASYSMDMIILKKLNTIDLLYFSISSIPSCFY